MRIWELMTEGAQRQIKDMWDCSDSDEIDEIIENLELAYEVEDFSEYLDEFKCFQFGDFICKTENKQITKVYFLYEIYATQEFGDNKELLLIVGHDKAAVINRNTLDEITHLYHH